jgi:peptidyl-prolyl cis-trans isomerase C
MGIAVNGVDIDDSAIEAEIGHHKGADNPLREAVHEVVLRQVLLQEARRLGVEGDSDDDRIEALFVREVTVPQADDAACRRFYQSQPERFRSGDLVEARHILFQVTPAAPLELLRQTAGLLAACACDAGCPSCVGPSGETGERGKLVATQILAGLMG